VVARVERKKIQVFDQALDREAQEAIITGKFTPGERLSEETLSASLHVGRWRCGKLRSLETEGYVTFLPNNEVAVSKPTREDVQDYHTIASVLEGLAPAGG
jgi:DNA-binding GntR family transcriptional regulator